MKILVIFTGGTIGSRIEDGWISPDRSCPYLLIDRFLQNGNAKDITLETASPYTILSENISAENIGTLLACVTEHAKQGYDGIIITHGTDTLQYTAAAVAFALGNTLPVVFVSSQLPIEDARSNADDNFAAAVALIRAQEKGVFAAYRNNDGTVYYHHATRLTRHGEASDDVYSLGGLYAGRCENGVFVKNPVCPPVNIQPLGAYTLAEDADILNILIHPGDDYRYDLTDVKAVLLQPYHSGTLNTESEAFAAFCAKAKQQNIPLFLVNVPTGVTYSSAKRFDELGVLPLLNSAAIPTFVKLWIAVSNGKDIAEFMNTPL